MLAPNSPCLHPRANPRWSTAFGLLVFLLPLLIASSASAQVAAGPPASGPVDDQVMAWVGNQPIFASEIMVRVDQLMEEHRKQIPPERWNEQRVALSQQALKVAVESKLVLVDAFRKIPPRSGTNP
ncbi:MAG: hypothetical protein K8T91_19540 [Planctomycetes bacterium]|nr:hypothetical protein [Planctomycetota bacterium]